MESLSTWRNQSRRVIGVHIRQLLMHSALSNTQAQPGSRDSRCVASSGIGTPPSAGRSVSDGGRRRRVIENSCVCSSVLLFLFSLIFITLTALCTIKYTLQLWKIKLGPWLSDYWNPMWAETFFFIIIIFFFAFLLAHLSRSDAWTGSCCFKGPSAYRRWTCEGEKSDLSDDIVAISGR